MMQGCILFGANGAMRLHVFQGFVGSGRFAGLYRIVSEMVSLLNPKPQTLSPKLQTLNPKP